MIRNLKALGLALVAIFAMSAMVASAASATTTYFTTTKGATLGSENEGKVQFTVTGQEVFCEESAYNGEAPSAEFTSVNVTPVYSGCKTGIGTSAAIDGFGAGECYFVLYANGQADLECATGKEVTVTAATCTVHIPAQTGLGTITYTTVDTPVEPSGTVEALTLHLNIQKIKGNHTDGFLCPFGSSGNSETGVLEGTIKVWAEVEGTKVDLTDHTE